MTRGPGSRVIDALVREPVEVPNRAQVAGVLETHAATRVGVKLRLDVGVRKVQESEAVSSRKHPVP